MSARRTSSARLEKPFIFFGCWNNIDCDERYTHRDIVLDYIKEYEKNIKQLYLAGDNWYQNIFKKENGNKKGHFIYKFYLYDVLKSGYDKIYGLNKQTYVALGNHDVDISKKRKKRKNDPNRECILKTQKYYIDQLNKGSTNIIMPTLDSLQAYIANMVSSLPLRRSYSTTALLTKDSIDSSNQKHQPIILYDHIGVVRHHRHYIMIIINTNELDDDEYFNKIKNEIIINRRLNQHKTIFVLGHHPILSYKDEEIEPLEIGDLSTLDDFFDLLSENNCIYLCADTHNFSIVKISKGDKSLIQIVSGTGGADPSKIKFEDINHSKTDNFESYNIQYISINSFGYTKIYVQRRDNTHNIEVVYTQVINAFDNGNNIPLQYKFTIKDYDDIQEGTVEELKTSSFLSDIIQQKYKDEHSSICDTYKSAFTNQNMTSLVVTNQNTENPEYCYKNYKFKRSKSANKLLRQSSEQLAKPMHNNYPILQRSVTDLRPEHMMRQTLPS